MEPVVGPGRRPGRMDDSRSERSIRDTAADATIASGSARLREGDKAAGGDALDVGGGAVGQKLALDATADDAVVGLKYAGKGVSEKRDKTTALGYGYIASDKKTPSGDRWDDTDARRSNRAPVDELRRKGEAWGLDTDRDGATAPDGTVHTGAYAFALPANPEPKPQSELAKAGEDVVKRADMEKELADFAGKPEHFAVMDNGVRWPPPDLGFALQIETDKTEPQQKKEVMSEVEERLQNIVIPSIEFRQHSIADVVRHLNEQIARQDPEGKAGRIELSKDVTEPLAAAPASAADTSSDSTSGLAITLNLRKVTALDAVRYVTEVANLKRHSEDGRIIISPSAAISGAMSTRIAKCTIRPKKEGVRPSDHEIQEFLTKAGVPFPKGSRVSYDPNTSLLTVRNTPENLEIFDIVAPALHAGEEPTPVAPTFKPAGFNPVVEAAENAFSTFSIDVDTASYTMARRSILEGRRPEPESVRTEEFVNAFDYDYAPPSKGAFAIHVDGAASPFRKSMDVLRIGIKGRRIGRDQHVPSNLTLVIDTSGSMQTDDRIGLIRRSLRMLVDQLDPEDRVAVVQFGSKAALRLEPTPAAQKDEILRVIDSLETVGSTQLEGGLKLGYEVAARAFRSGASNRVILMSDGVANLGATESAGILSTVEAHRKQGVRLTVLGFGTGAYNDAMLESLADKGDGAYTFIDSEEEAKRVLVDNLAATLHVIASDVKIQVEFNPRRVQRWRQLGYENRALTKEQFRDDTVDAGEVGSGQSVTALYDVQLDGSASEWIGTVRVRYRDVETGRVEEIERRITARDFTRDFAAASPRFRLAAGVAELAELLRLSPHTFSQGRDLADALGVLRPVALELSIDPQVQELVRLAQAAQSLP
jgi:Ca-activated chloride channel family protein